jgi:hypothetical protein
MAKINTIFSFQDKVTPGLKKMNQEVKRTSGSFSEFSSKLLSISSAIQIFRSVSNAINKVTASVNECVQAYQYQNEQELKLTTIMKQRMNATDADVQSIKDFAREQQKLGIYGDELILQGAQELASFVSQKEAIETLIPAMNNLIAQQYGYNASGQQFQSTADMIGKVLSGQTGALSRMGYVFSEEEKQLLKTGDEMQRASVLAKIITDNVGEMNQALAGTSTGGIQAINNNISDMKENIGALLVPWQQFVKSISSRIKMKAFELIEKALKWVNEHMKEVKIGIMAVAGAMGVASAIFIGHLIAVKVATITANSEMALAWLAGAWPIALIIALIAGIGVGLYQLLKHCDTVFPAIGGFFTGLMAVGYKVRYTLWNGIKTLIEGIVNGFKSMGYNCVITVFNMANKILEIIKKVTDAMDNVFGTNFSESINKKMAENELIKKYYENEKAKKWEWKLGGENGELSDQEKMMLYFGNMSFKDAWSTGQTMGKQMGAETAQKFQNWIGDVKDGIVGSAQGIMGEISDSNFDFKTDGSGALVVSDKNLVDIADNYRELLSKRATERFNLQYKSVTPAVNISKMEVNNGMDENAILNKIADGLGEMANSSLSA